MYVTETQVYCVEDAENSLVMVGKMVDTIVASVVARKSVSAAPTCAKKSRTVEILGPVTEGSTTNVELESCLSADWEYLRGSRTAFVGSTIEVFAKSFDFSRELGMVSWLPHGASTSDSS